MSSEELDYTPELEEVIQLAIEQRLFDLNVSLPAAVESFDPATQTAFVQPQLQRSYNGVLINLPVIQNVPVVFPSAASWSLTGPINAGDTGHVIFSQRSLDVWKKSGGLVNPNDPRKFHITDAVFYPGLSPASKSKKAGANLMLKNGTTEFELFPSGKFALRMNGGDELLDLLIQVTSQLITVTDTLSKDTVNTMMGPQPLLQASAYASAKSALSALKGKLSGIKG